ncbi:uncharacterized protein LJ206_000514 isoform 2-T2 [Theristicus caerulescens]
MRRIIRRASTGLRLSHPLEGQPKTLPPTEGSREEEDCPTPKLGLSREAFNQLLSSLRAAFQSEQRQDLGEDMAKKQAKGRSPPEESLLRRRKLPPVTFPVQKRTDGKGEQALGAKPPESVLPAIEGSSVQEGKSKTTHQGRRKTEIPACKGHRRVGQEICYLCMQQEERNLRAALLEEKEKQESAKQAEQQAWQASMAALNAQRRACAVLKLAVDKRGTKEDLEESRDCLKSYWPTPPACIRRREYDRELQERREVWGWEPKRVPAKISLQHHTALPAFQTRC